MNKYLFIALCSLGLSVARSAPAQEVKAAPPAAAVAYDAELAKSLGGDERGMRAYVLVILKAGPNKIPAGPAREAMFKGHFANINTLAAEKKLALAGPLDSAVGWRGLFVMATPDIEVARSYVAADPVIISGEMVAEYHKFYGSAALMTINDVHARVAKK